MSQVRGMGYAPYHLAIRLILGRQLLCARHFNLKHRLMRQFVSLQATYQEVSK